MNLCPAMEDMVGAGAILAALHPTTPSPEAEAIAAIAVYAAAAAALHPFIAACSSGRELTDLGYAGDVEAAAQLDASETAPVLRDGAFRSSPPCTSLRRITNDQCTSHGMVSAILSMRALEMGEKHGGDDEREDRPPR
jgi:hypothetical protein